MRARGRSWGAIPFLSWLFLAAVRLAAAPAMTCPAAGPLPDAPVTASADSRYFVYKGRTLPLLGQAAEYLCPIRQPERPASYCTLESHAAVLDDMAAKGNNLLWLWAILNSSPGVVNAARGLPYAHETPVAASPDPRDRWDLAAPPDAVYLANLETVVCEAYRRGIVVAVTLLDPWSPPWSSSPWNRQNTTDPESQGFTSRRLFATFEDTEAKADVAPQNVFTRERQKALVAAVVERLRKYPNLIWEIANEPDLIPTGVTATPAQVLDWQLAMLEVVREHDSLPPHLVAINGHTPATFGWNVPGAQVASSHYAQIAGDSHLFGALEMLRDDTPSIVEGRALRVVGFNENKAASTPGVPVGHALYRTADSVRAEAWELFLRGGGLFAGYTLDRSAAESRKVVAQLGVLSRFLAPPSGSAAPEAGGRAGLSGLGAMRPATCSEADWCRGIPPPAAPDRGVGCRPSPDVPPGLQWATLKSDDELALYLHHSVFRSTQGGRRFDAYQAVPCGDGRSSGYRSSGLQFRVPRAGCWAIQWIDPASGATLARERRNLDAGVWTSPATFPFYRHDVVFLISRVRAGRC